MLKFLTTTAAVALLALAGPALAQTSPQTQSRPSAGAPATTGGATNRSDTGKKEVDRGDRKFIENAASDGMKEVELGKLAQQKAQNPQVKQLADTIVKDHEEANQKLMTVAQSAGVDVSKAQKPDAHKKAVDDYQKLSGADFDKKYVDAMVKDHLKDVKEFKDAAKNAKDPQLKSFAAEVAPKLEQHLQLAEAAQKSMQPQTSRGPSESRGAAGSSTAPAGGMAGSATGGATRPAR
jgi:putative membrane protein